MQIRSWWTIGLPGVSWITQPSLSTADTSRPGAPATDISGAHWTIVHTWELARQSPLVLQAPRACVTSVVNFAHSAPWPAVRTISISPPPTAGDHAAPLAG
ncbi:MAG: hypothetical protein ACRD5F_11385 [Candidatus Acidiferrales bacterium]